MSSFDVALGRVVYEGGARYYRGERYLVRKAGGEQHHLTSDLDDDRQRSRGHVRVRGGSFPLCNTF